MSRVEVNFQRFRMADVYPRRGKYRPLSRSHRMPIIPAAFVQFTGLSDFSIRTGKERYNGLVYTQEWAHRKVAERHTKRQNKPT